MFKKKFSPLSKVDVQFNLKEMIKKAKKHNYQYINPEAVKNIMGKWTPISIWLFSYLLDNYIGSMNETGSSIMSPKGTYKAEPEAIPIALKGIGDKLLKANKNYKPGTWNLFNDLDFDICHQCVKGETVETIVKPYFYFDEFKRGDEARVVLHATVARFEEASWTISIPLQYIMKGFPNIKKQHYGYAHKIAVLDDNGQVENEYVYIGVTGRDWLKRMSEHFNEIKNGSNKLFHKSWREFTGKSNVLLNSELIIGDHTYEQIMAWEETMVDRCMDSGHSLNMIPGGFKGMKFLHEHRLLNNDKANLEERDAAILEYQKQHPRAGISNILISELWKDDNYASKIICGPEGRLSVQQVQKIRELDNTGIPIEKICEMVDALNINQIQRVLSGKTYTRIH
ncbi:MAG: hypothetical protein JKX90_08780 [Colwellia sp.]|nr:hypothetical protein [Colwellia sp.]